MDSTCFKTQLGDVCIWTNELTDKFFDSHFIFVNKNDGI